MLRKNNRASRFCSTFPLAGSLLLLLTCPSSVISQVALTLDGKPTAPLQSSAGKIAVLVFVRTDCPISNRYAPLLQNLSEKFRGEAKFWLVYPDKKTSPAEITEHLNQFRNSIPALRDPDHSLVNLAAVTTTPEAAVFDRHGKLLYHGRIDNFYVDAGRSRPAATTHELNDAIESAAFGKTLMPASAPAVGCYISDTK